MDWKSIFKSIKCIPPAWDRIHAESAKSSSFCFTINSFKLAFDNIDLTSLSYSVSFFDAYYSQFYGAQYRSESVRGKLDENGTFTISSPENLFFHTSILEEACLIVVEVIGLRKDTKKPKACGWGFMRLFRQNGNIVDCSSKKLTAPLQEMELYRGSSRALLYLHEPIENTPALSMTNNNVLQYTIRTHHLMDSCCYLIPENTWINPRSTIPGLVRSVKGLSHNLLKPQLLPLMTYTLSKLQIRIEPNAAIFEEQIRALIDRDRLQRDNVDPEKAGESVVIVDRCLRIGVHNGWTYIDDEVPVHLLPHNPDNRRSSHRYGRLLSEANQKGAKADCFMTKNPVEVELPEDPGIALVFVLEYVISEPKTAEERRLTQSMGPSGQTVFSIRWSVYLPFENDSSLGEKDLPISLQMEGGPNPSPNETLFFTEVMEQKISVHLTGHLQMKKKAETEERIEDSKDKTEVELRRPPLPKGKSVNVDEDGILEPTNQRTVQGAQRSDQEVLPFQGSQDSSYLLSSGAHTAQLMLYHQLMQSLFHGGKSPYLSMDTSAYEPIRSVPIPPYLSTPAPFLPLAMKPYKQIGLSRAVYARLYSANFPQILDRNSQSATVIETSDRDPPFDMTIEERDSLQCNEIIFQFLAYAHIVTDQAISMPKSIYFTFQFYRLPIFTSQRLALYKGIGDVASDPNIQPFILQCLTEDGQPDTSQPPGLTVKYDMNPTFLKPGEGRVLLEHLNQQKMHIDVWDGDSHMLLGSCGVQLKPLCRQGREAVQSTFELDVTQSGDCGDDDFSQRRTLPNSCGRLHLRVGNVGHHVSNHRLAQVVFANQKRKTLIEPTEEKGLSKSTRFSASITNLSNSAGVINPNLQNGLDGTQSGGSRVVRARHAVEIHSELAQLINSHKKPLTSGHHLSGSLAQGLNKINANGDKSPAHIIQHPPSSTQPLSPREMERRRKLSRLEALERQSPSHKSMDPSAHSILSQHADREEKFRELRAVDVYRSRMKREHIQNILCGVVTAEHTLYPVFGAAEFFEYRLKNPYNVEQTVVIHISDEYQRLSLVTDPREIRALKLVFGVTTPTEDDLFHWDENNKKPNLFLRPKESVLVPFKYVELLSSTILDNVKEKTTTNVSNFFNTDEHSITIEFYSMDQRSSLVGKLLLKVVPQPPVIDQSFRFYQPEQSFLKKTIRLPPMTLGNMQNNPQTNQVFLRSSDPTVIAESAPASPGDYHDVMIKVPCGPSPQIRRFLVSMYLDPFLLRPAQVWHFTIHSQQRIDVSARQGQITPVHLLLRGTESTRRVTLHSSHPHELFVPDNSGSPEEKQEGILLTAGAVHEIKLALKPERTGNRVFHFHVVDSISHQLVRSWLILAQVKTPEVSKAFDLALPLGGGKGSNKRVSYKNPYPYQKTFYLSTDRPDLLQFKDQEISVDAGASEFIGFRFMPCMRPGVQNMLVFLNDADGNTEDAFAIKATYA